MAQAVGSLFIDLAMNTAAFASDLGKAQTSLSSWASTSNRTMATVVNAFRGVTHEITGLTAEVFTLKGAFLTLLGGGVIGEFIKRNLEGAAALVDHAHAMGISTDALQEYTFIAKLSGVSQETLNGALEKFGKNLGQLQAGTGSLSTFLEKTNVGLLKQLQSVQTVDEGMKLLMDTMGKMDNQQGRLALSAAAFSKGGLEMTNMVVHGTEEMEALRAKAHELGIVIDADLLRNAKAAEDQMDTLSMVLKAKMMTAVIQNADRIVALADALIALTALVVRFAAVVVDLLSPLIHWQETTTELGLSIDEFVISLMKIGPAMAQFSPISSVAEAAKQQLKDLNEMADNVAQEAAERVAKLKSGASLAPKAAQPKDSTGITGYLKQQREEAAATADALKKADEAQQKLLDDAKSTYEKTRTPLEKYNERLAQLKQELDEGLISQETYNRAVGQAADAYEKATGKGQLWSDLMSKSIHGQIKSWQDLGKAVLDYAQNLLTAIATGQKSGGIGIGDVGKILGTFGLGGTSSASTSSSSGSAFGGIGNWIASWFHGGGTVGGGGGMRRSVHPGVFAGARRMHAGGLAGDEVPAILQKGEQVLTQQQAKQRSSGGGINIEYLDARGADSGVEMRLRLALAELSDSIERRSVKAVQSASFRNPSLLGGRG